MSNFILPIKGRGTITVIKYNPKDDKFDTFECGLMFSSEIAEAICSIKEKDVDDDLNEILTNLYDHPCARLRHAVSSRVYRGSKILEKMKNDSDAWVQTNVALRSENDAIKLEILLTSPWTGTKDHIISQSDDSFLRKNRNILLQKGNKISRDAKQEIRSRLK